MITKGQGGSAMTEPPGWSSPAPGGAWSAPAAAPPPGWGALPPRPPEVRPGVVPLRPLGVGEIIDGAISTMRRHWKLQLGLSAAVVTVVSVLQAGALWLVYRNTSGIEGGDVTGPETSAAANVAQVITVVVGQLAQMVLLGILVFIVSRAVLGDDVTPHQAWAAVKPYLWKLIWLSVLVMLLMGVIVGTAVLVTVAVAVAGAPTGAVVAVAVVCGLVAAPGAVWVWVKLGVSAPALVLERTGIRGAMRRSGRLVRRSWWRVFGVLLLSTVISTVLGGIIQTPFTFGAFLTGFDLDGNEAPGVWFYVLTTIGSAIAGTITYPFSAGVAALLYIDLRMRREALDITLVRAARAGGRA
jgi:hypothetical protein